MPKTPKKENDKAYAVTVIQAALALIGTIVTAYLGYKAGYNMIWIPITTTQTAEARLTQQVVLPETVELQPATSTPSPLIILETSTPIAAIPGQDWADGCVNSAVWVPYIAGETLAAQGQCHQLSEWGIFPQNGRLNFASHHSQSSAYEYGIFTPWNPAWTELDFSAVVDRQENSELWVGFLEGNTLNSRGIVFVIQPGNMIDIRELPYESVVVDNTDLKYAEGKFHTKVIFEGGEVTVWVDEQGIISKWPVSFTVHNFFVGYRALPNTNLNASVYDLNFKP